MFFGRRRQLEGKSSFLWRLQTAVFWSVAFNLNCYHKGFTTDLLGSERAISVSSQEFKCYSIPNYIKYDAISLSSSAKFALTNGNKAVPGLFAYLLPIQPLFNKNAPKMMPPPP